MGINPWMDSTLLRVPLHGTLHEKMPQPSFDIIRMVSKVEP
jgi:hypothetical protein